ncbi:hypothetical protein DAEQUDRAFT_397811 [Daedalea quercina L-15889]|uniref:F-box domain-containing protein n=1 Tax=Daedalea quercina L-15889 TaxID=1314783 RepID=A0A165NTR5_9APHY|nr:hypothetical protein DAEQUDRAFT_397811 [Daedalea quercina L-15889]
MPSVSRSRSRGQCRTYTEEWRRAPRMLPREPSTELPLDLRHFGPPEQHARACAGTSCLPFGSILRSCSNVICIGALSVSGAAFIHPMDHCRDHFAGRRDRHHAPALACTLSSHLSLPIELWEMVIDSLIDEPQALLACAFVCKAWFVRCRMHLTLGVLQLGHHRDVIRLSRFVRAHHAFAKREFVSIQGSTLASKSLAHLPMFTAQLAGRMPCLESLFIEHGVWRTGMTDVGFFTRVASFTSISRLTLNDVTLPSTSIFAQLVCALGRLVELYCVNVKTVKKRSGERLCLPLTRHSRLSHLTLVGPHVHDIIEFLVDGGLAQRLSDLTLHVGHVGYQHFIHMDAVAYRELLAACWCLRVLHLRVRAAMTSAVNPDDVSVHYLHLGTTHKLEVLHLSVEPHLYGDYRFGWATTLLSYVSSSSAIRELVITFDIQGETDGRVHDSLLTKLSDETDMTLLDRVLASRRYARLENVEVILCVGHVESRLVKSREALWVERIETQLQEVRRKGILS